MRRFQFEDASIDGNEEYDISGKEYITLISTCLQYSRYMSFRISSVDTNIPVRMLQHKVETSQEIMKVYSHYGNNVGKILTLIVYNELIEDMLQVSTSVFGWINGWNLVRPEDFAFYREDYSVFFYSRIHEGYCYLFAREDENVDNVIKGHGWSFLQSDTLI